MLFKMLCKRAEPLKTVLLLVGSVELIEVAANGFNLPHHEVTVAVLRIAVPDPAGATPGGTAGGDANRLHFVGGNPKRRDILAGGVVKEINDAVKLSDM